LPQRQLLAIMLVAAIWLCPLWQGPTAVVPSMLWGAAGLGGFLLLDATAPKAQAATQPAALQKLFLWLLLSLALMIIWRSANPQNTLATALCLAAIGLAASLSAKAQPASPARLMAWGWLLAGLINAAFGLSQYFGWTSEPLGTAFGFLRQRNNFATLSNIALLALLYLWHHQQLRTTLAAGAGLLLTAALVASTSRAGLLGLVAIMLLMCFKKNLRKAAALLALAYCLFAWALPYISHAPETMLGRLSHTTEGGQLQDSRRVMWDNTLVVIQQHPLLGVGWRELDLALHLADFGTAPRFPGQVDNAHNLPLQLAAELGIPFAALWCGTLAWLILRNKPWQSRTPERLLGWSILLVIGIHSLLEYPLWYAPFQIAAGFAAGLVFVKPPCQSRPAASHNWQGLAGISLLAFAVYAAFDYHRVRQLFIPDAERSALYRANPRAHAETSWLFAAQVQYAKLSTMSKSASHAAQTAALAQEVLHFSPEPWVFEAQAAACKQLAAMPPTFAPLK
jgi:O-antigen ligase